MSKTEWFRRDTWTDIDRDDFIARLKRARGAGNKAQYLRIQEEVSHVLHEFREREVLTFPAIEYRYAAIQAMLADARGEKSRAREFAKQALAEAAKEHSGMRYHPTVGLVGTERKTFAARLRMLAGC
jgi:hypothetical protein